MSSTFHGNNIDSPEQPTLSAQHLRALFPFHIAFDTEMQITHYGEKLTRLCPALKTGDLFSEHFQIRRPLGMSNFESFCRQLGALYIVQLRSSHAELKGQMVRLEANLLLFLCSPLVRNLSEVQSLGLTLQDFPLYDPSGDFLFLLQAQRTTIEEAKALIQRLSSLNEAFRKYVPQEFLKLLQKESILHIKLGDHVQKTMTVLFSDIRSFTTLSESMSPQDTFNFINSYLKKMEPMVSKQGGFIDKYIGDAIMALFDKEPEDAVKAALDMLQTLIEYNQGRKRDGYLPIQIGIGINTGSSMLGTIGGENRMEGTVISDAVNLASRIGSMTKIYGAPLLIGEETFFNLKNPISYCVRKVDQVRVKGRSKLVTLFEVFDSDIAEIKEAKLATLKTFEKAISLYFSQQVEEALPLFQTCFERNPLDKAVQLYFERCQTLVRGSNQSLQPTPPP
jgi:class 3 adenylate cyclase